MKTFIILSLISFVIFTSAASVSSKDGVVPLVNPITALFRNDVKSSDAVTEHWFETKIDHFNSAETRTFRARYLENGEFYKPGGPIIIIIGGQYELIESFLSVDGSYYPDLAKEHNAYLFSNEHRFYGKTQPFGDTSNPALAYLTLENVLADTATFISHIKSTRSELASAKIILVGFSYSGGLATFFTYIYPGVVDAVWSSSGAVIPIADFQDYNVAAGEGYRVFGGDACYKGFETGFKEIEDLINRGTTTLIEQAFDLCEPMDTSSKLDMEHFIWVTGNQMASVIQLAPPAFYPQICATVTDPKYNTRLEAIGAVARFLNGEECLKAKYRDYVNFFRNTDLEHPVNFAYRQYYYMACTEGGWFMTTNSPDQPFGTRVNLTLFANFCTDVYGRTQTPQMLEENSRRTRLRFGGEQRAYRRVVTTHGEWDPWKYAGLVEDRTGEGPVFVTKDESHCTDVLYPVSLSPPELKPARDFVDSWIRRWIA